MKIVKSIEELISYRKNVTSKVGFVPTMGALHNGHLSLIKQARIQNDIVILSIFVNPTQFLPNEDFNSYPRKEEADIKIATLAGVDVVFAPDVNEMYSLQEPKVIAPRDIAYILEGKKRPGHFDGVLSVLMKLFHIVKPHNAYFGKKDAQQLFLVQNMIDTYFLPINIVPCDIIRDADGLALSSRNIYLDSKQRAKALSLSVALKNGSQAIMKGEREVVKIEKIMREALKEVEVDYATVLSRDFKFVEHISIKETLLLIAAYVDNVRLIDNLWI